MRHSEQRRTLVALPMAAVAIFILFVAVSAQAQTYSVLHYFTGGADGGNPVAGVTVAGPGLLYGTTSGYSTSIGNLGTVFKLNQRGSGWILDPLYVFNGPPDDAPNGDAPWSGVAVGPNGALYGTTVSGGVGNGGFGWGTVYEVQPPANACKTAICYWSETVLHAFAGGTSDGGFPEFGNVTFDPAGNMYGTGSEEGADACGVVWELSPSASGWTESILYNFTDGGDGCHPQSGVVLDPAGNLYGVTSAAGTGTGTVFQVVPYNGGWTENTVLQFSGSIGIHPYGRLFMDEHRNLYGTASDNGPHGGGTVFELSPFNGGWTFTLIYSFSTCQPEAGVTLGPDGNLYGVCRIGPGRNQHGWVFKMPTNCNQTCTPTDLHDFDFTHGADPRGTVAFDANGNLYGTTFAGGIGECTAFPDQCGVVWEITPN